MSIKIDKKIVSYEVAKPEDDHPGADSAAKASNDATGNDARVSEEQPTADVIQMHEQIQRPEELEGSTYKIKTPMFEHALYVTINDIVLNRGTDHEHRRPFEIFINSKNMDHFQWIVALTRIMSAVFRKGGDVTFLVEEMRNVFDPRGGYFKRGGRYMPSLVAEIGDIIERHLIKIGLLQPEGPEAHQQALIDQKRREHAERQEGKARSGEANGDFPADAALCDKCFNKAMIFMDGCLTCLNCGESKCG